MSEEMTTYNAATGIQTKAGNASQEVAGTREMAEVQAAVFMARQFPRDERAAIDKIMTACQRPGLAQTAIYTYAKGGQEVAGASIRMAETIARLWGNIQYGVRELEQRSGESTCEAFAWDVETNTRVTKSFKVSHLRHTRRGDYMITDPREIYEAVANNGARRVRACILGIIPGDVIEAALAECEKTIRADANVTPESIAKLVSAFADLGVSKTQIEGRIQRRIDAVTPAQVVNLRKIYTAIKDGMSNATDWFEPVAAKDEAKAEKKPAKPTLAGIAKSAKAPKATSAEVSLEPPMEPLVEDEFDPEMEEPPY